MSFSAIVWAFKQPADDPLAKLLLLTLASRADDNGDAWPSQLTLASDTGMSRRSVQNKIETLISTGLVRVRSRTAFNGVQNVYSLVMEPAQDAGAGYPADTRGSAPDAPGVAHQVRTTHSYDPIKNSLPAGESTRARASSRNAQLPEGWQPSPELLQWAHDNFPTVEVRHETEQFTDYHRARGQRRVDWPASWRTWIRNAARFARSPVTGGGRRSVDRSDPLLAEISRRLGDPLDGGWSDDPVLAALGGDAAGFDDPHGCGGHRAGDQPDGGAGHRRAGPAVIDATPGWGRTIR